MAKRKTSTSAKASSSRGVNLKAEQFRSMILDKLRLDIDSKRAALDQALKLSAKDLANMSYWKMKYWKMKYWKMGHQVLPADQVINPASAAKTARARKRSK